MQVSSFRRVSAGAVVFAVLAAFASSALGAAPATAPSSVDPAQAARGRAAYGTACASCHGLNLSGGGAPALKGASFVARNMGSAAALTELDRNIRRMPKQAPHSLPAKTYADIKAYILAANGYKPPAAPVAASAHGAPVKPAAGKPAATAKAAPREVLPAAPKTVAQASTSAPTDAELIAPADGDWPMYNRDFSGQRFSRLDQINTATAGRLKPVCILQLGEPGAFHASPIFYKGVGYVTTTYSVMAFDGATCARKWSYTHTPVGPEGFLANRGAALYEGKVFRGTTDGHLLALDAATGALLWDAHVADAGIGYFIGAAPVVYQGRVIIGLGGGDSGAPGHIYAFDAKTGRRVWTFDSVASRDQPGAETWQKGAEHGGGATWTSFAADPKDGLVFAPVGNPGPDFLASARPGANLYTNSVVALDAATGKLAWYVQQIAGDYHDWDTAAPPMIYEQDGRRYLAAGSKDGHVYLYDRDTRALISKTPVTTIKNADAPLSFDKKTFVCPGFGGGVEWYGPAYSPQTKAVYVGTVDWCGDYQLQTPAGYKPGGVYMEGEFSFAPPGEQKGWLKALDGATGKELWSYAASKPMVGGVTPTAGGVILTGGSDGDFLVFDAKDGRTLYRFHTGGAVGGGVSTYLVDGRQYVAVASGNRSGLPFGVQGSPTVVVFALDQAQ